MERASLPGLAPGHAQRLSAGGLRELRRRLESLAPHRAVAAYWAEAALFTAILVAVWRFADLSLQRHAAFQSNAYDLAFFDQIVWNTSQGRLFETSFVSYNFLGQHFEPVLLIFAAWYRLGGDVSGLIVAQAVLAGAAAAPLFYAARRLTGSAGIALVIAGSYLLNPTLHRAVDFDFHPEALGLFFVFLALYFIADRRPTGAILALLPLLALKEDFFVVLFLFAAILALHGFRGSAIRLSALAAVWALLVPGLIMKVVRGGTPSDLLERYDYLFPADRGIDYPLVIGIRALEHFAATTLDGWLSLLSETGFVALLSPLALLAAALAGLPNGLSSHPQQAGLSLHYAVPSLAFTWVAIGFGLARLQSKKLAPSWVTSLTAFACALLLGASLFSFWTDSPYSPAEARTSLGADHQASLQRAMALIPESASVSAQSSILPHLSQRPRAFEFPLNPDADYVVVDARLPISGQALASGFVAELAALPGEYETIFAEQGVQVFRRR